MLIASEIDALAAEAAAILPPGTVVNGRIPSSTDLAALEVAPPPASPASPPTTDAAGAACTISNL